MLKSKLDHTKQKRRKPAVPLSHHKRYNAPVKPPSRFASMHHLLSSPTAMHASKTRIKKGLSPSLATPKGISFHSTVPLLTPIRLFYATKRHGCTGIMTMVNTNTQRRTFSTQNSNTSDIDVNVNKSTIDTYLESMADTTQLFANIEANPLVAPSTLPYGAPDFSKIKFEHFKPAILYGMKQQLEEVDQIVNNPDVPTFENTCEALEFSGKVMSRAHTTFANLSYSDSTDEIMQLEDELSPLLSNHHDDIYLNDALFQRYKTVYDQYKANQNDFKQKHGDEAARLLEVTYTSFVLSGANLNQEQKEQMRQYNENLSALENKFSQHLLKIEATEFLVIENKAELDGLSEEEISAAKSLAIERKVITEEQACDEASTKYVLNLVNTSRNPALLSLKNPEVRKKLFDLSINRGLAGEFDNSEIVYEVLTTRAKVAELLGFKNFSEYQLIEEMAQTPVTALNLLTSMMPGVIKSIDAEKALLLEEKKKITGNDTAIINAEDWEFFAERVRETKFQVDANLLKEYLCHENILKSAMMKSMKKLYGIVFEKRTDIPTYHPDVEVFEVKEETGEGLGLFYADYMKRAGKSGGAWSTNFVPAHNGQKACVVNVMNVVKSANDNKPTFVPFSDVSTYLHEYGHGAHEQLSTAKYASLAGTNTSTDFVEFPSTINEDISLLPEVLAEYARHYETNEPIPSDLLKAVLKSSKWNSGFETYEYLASSIIDLGWHSMNLTELESVFSKYPSKAEAIKNHEVEILKNNNAYISYIPPRYRTAFFNHSLTGYSSRYYAYMWSEIMAADAFAYIKKNGLNREMGDKFRREVLSRGNSRPLMESFIAFRGQEPTTDAILKRRGLLNDSDDETQ